MCGTSLSVAELLRIFKDYPQVLAALDQTSSNPIADSILVQSFLNLFSITSQFQLNLDSVVALNSQH